MGWQRFFSFLKVFFIALILCLPGWYYWREHYSYKHIAWAVDSRNNRVLHLSLVLGGKTYPAGMVYAPSLLRQAVHDSFYEGVKLLIQNSGPAEKDISLEEALCMATQLNDTRMIKLILDLGANINNVNEEGPGAELTPLHFATTIGAEKAVKTLLDHGADPNINKRYHGETPLHTAVLNYEETIIGLLIEGGADTSLKTNNGSTAMDIFLGRDIHYKNPQLIKSLLSK